jgi:general secretion pathway protein A
MEIMPKVKKIKNFFDRITLKYIINPLDEEETKDMIEFRLRQAGHNGPSDLFSDGAVKLIHEHTMGYPRKIAVLCHNALELAVMRDRRVIDEPMILEIIRNEVM